ncbi:hypothetical protein CCONF_05480 [Corynebacterium confusum]|nr:hypothetical protein CCONF_05480 [Corynebacterium confusum]
MGVHGLQTVDASLRVLSRVVLLCCASAAGALGRHAFGRYPHHPATNPRHSAPALRRPGPVLVGPIMVRTQRRQVRRIRRPTRLPRLQVMDLALIRTGQTLRPSTHRMLHQRQAPLLPRRQTHIPVTINRPGHRVENPHVANLLKRPSHQLGTTDYRAIGQLHGNIRGILAADQVAEILKVKDHVRDNRRAHPAARSTTGTSGSTITGAVTAGEDRAGILDGAHLGFNIGDEAGIGDKTHRPQALSRTPINHPWLRRRGGVGLLDFTPRSRGHLLGINRLGG